MDENARAGPWSSTSAFRARSARICAARSTPMKKKKMNPTKRPVARHITRREFGGGGLAAGVVAGAPAILRGRNLNDKLDIAFIAAGGRAKASLNELTITPGRGAAGAGRRSEE